MGISIGSSGGSSSPRLLWSRGSLTMQARTPTIKIPDFNGMFVFVEIIVCCMFIQSLLSLKMTVGPWDHFMVLAQFAMVVTRQTQLFRVFPLFTFLYDSFISFWMMHTWQSFLECFVIRYCITVMKAPVKGQVGVDGFGMWLPGVAVINIWPGASQLVASS